MPSKTSMRFGVVYKVSLSDMLSQFSWSFRSWFVCR